MNAIEKAVALNIYTDLHIRMTNVREHAEKKLFGDKVAAEDKARADGLAIALQYMAEHIYDEYQWDVEKAFAEQARKAAKK